MTKIRDPFQIFDIDPSNYDDKLIRSKYLELIKNYTPEQNPEKFEEIRSAYSILKNAKSPYDVLSIVPVNMNSSLRSKQEILADLEKSLGIKKKKIEYKRTMLLKQLEETSNDTRN
jgi:curved DNA-binding protein CbpA